MNEVEGGPLKRDSHYFEVHYQTIQRRIEEFGIKQDEEKIVELVNRIPKKRLVESKRPSRLPHREGLSQNQRSVFNSLRQARREITEAVVEGDLSLSDANVWNERFGFKKIRPKRR